MADFVSNSDQIERPGSEDSDIERRILMTLRFIYSKTSKPQPATRPSVMNPGSNISAESNFEG